MTILNKLQRGILKHNLYRKRLPEIENQHGIIRKGWRDKETDRLHWKSKRKLDANDSKIKEEPHLSLTKAAKHT